jgi:hypothetical protein
MTAQHQQLANGRWQQFSLVEQLAHVGSEVDRAAHWKKKGDTVSSHRSIDRALELIDLTLDDRRWNKRYKEIARAREVLCDHFYGDNEYQSTTESLQRYFFSFAMAAAKHR